MNDCFWSKKNTMPNGYLKSSVDSCLSKDFVLMLKSVSHSHYLQQCLIKFSISMAYSIMLWLVIDLCYGTLICKYSLFYINFGLLFLYSFFHSIIFLQKDYLRYDLILSILRFDNSEVIMIADDFIGGSKILNFAFIAVDLFKPFVHLTCHHNKLPFFLQWVHLHYGSQCLQLTILST